MFTRSLWNSFSGTTTFPKLNNDIEVDVAIVGGGITEISTAQLLVAAGFSVAVLETRKVSGGTTSHSTGNLYSNIDQVLSSLRSKYSYEIIRKVISSRNGAIDLIERNVKNFQIDCDFQRVPFYLFSANEENSNKIDKELETSREAGIKMEVAAKAEIPLEMTRGVKVDNQAQFNPMRYVQDLAHAIESDSCRIYENTRVEDLDEGDDHVKVRTSGGKVTAKYAVHATHTPIGVKMMFHTVLGALSGIWGGCQARLGNLS